MRWIRGLVGACALGALAWGASSILDRPRERPPAPRPPRGAVQPEGLARAAAGSQDEVRDPSGGVAPPDVAASEIRPRDALEAVREAVLNIRGMEGQPVRYQFDLYRQTLEDQLHGVDVRQFWVSRELATEAFLWLESVQEELAALDSADRQREITRIRREMGYSEEEIAALTALDTKREARWQNGWAYMRERARVIATFEGDIREDELRRLREAHFGIEARTIEREEADGFFRFERRRIHGWN